MKIMHDLSWWEIIVASFFFGLFYAFGQDIASMVLR